jgi:hypothetical protein
MNKKFFEFLFENLKGKPDIFEKKVKELKEINEKLLNKQNNFQNHSFKKNSQYFLQDNENNINNMPSQKNNILCNQLQKVNNENYYNTLKDNSMNVLNNNMANELLSCKSNDKDNKYMGRQTIKSYFNINKRESSVPNDKMKVKRRSAKKMSLVGNTKVHINSLFKQAPKNEYKHLVHKKLFPSRYYFYVIFIKNLDVLNKTKCVSKKFSKTYMFLTRLLDIFSYFDLVRQFNVFKTYCLSENNMHFIEKTRKINIADISFMKNIRECVDYNNFRIFGKMRDE